MRWLSLAAADGPLTTLDVDVEHDRPDLLAAQRPVAPLGLRPEVDSEALEDPVQGTRIHPQVNPQPLKADHVPVQRNT